MSKVKKSSVQPIGDRILVQPIAATEATIGGIYIPDQAKEKPTQGRVVAIGTGRLDENGRRTEFSVKVGDTVLMPKFGGVEVKFDGQDYQIMREEDILGIVR